MIRVYEVYDQNHITRACITYEGLQYDVAAGDLARDSIELLGTGVGMYTRRIDVRTPVEKAADDFANEIASEVGEYYLRQALRRLVTALTDEVREDLVKNAYVVQTDDGYFVRFRNV